MRHLVLVVVAAIVIAGGAPAFAQQAPQSATVQVDFPFVVGGKELPAGKYTVDAKQPGVIIVKGSAGASLSLATITSLGRHDKDPDPELVFDKVGGKMMLSEVWLPGLDGYLLLATKEPHEHAVVGGSKPRK